MLALQIRRLSYALACVFALAGCSGDSPNPIATDDVTPIIDDGTVALPPPAAEDNAVVPTDTAAIVIDAPVIGVTPPPPLVPPAVVTPPIAPPPAVTWSDCTDEAGNAAPHPLLATPSFALDFDSVSELAARGAKFTDEQIALEPGRSGQAARVVSGAVSVPFRDAINLERGTIGAWIGTGDWHPQLPQQLIIFQTENPLLNGKATGADFFLRLATAAPTTANPTPAANLLFYAGGISPTTNISASAANWGPGEWHHVAISWERVGTSQTFTMYLDGLPAGSMTAATPFDDTTAPQRLYLASTGRKDWKTTHPGVVRLDQLRSVDAPLPVDALHSWLRETMPSGGSMRSDRLELRVGTAQDGYGVLSVEDLHNARQLTTALATRQLWQLTLRAGATTQLLTNRAAGLAQLSCRQQSDQRALELSWRNIPLPLLSAQTADDRGSVDVVTMFTATDTGIDGTIRVQTHGAPWQLRTVHFPFGMAMAPVGSADQTELVLTGTNLGQLVRNPFARPTQRLAVAATSTPRGRWNWQSVYPSSDQPLPWWGFYNAAAPTSGVFVGIDGLDGAIATFKYQHVLDPLLSKLWGSAAGKASASELLSQPLWHGMRVDVEHAVPYGDDRAEYAPQWRWHIAAVDGDWFALAQHYRTRMFAAAPRWISAGALAVRNNFATWWKRIGVIQSATTFDTVQQLAASDPAGAPDSVLWHYAGWQDNSNAQTNDMPAKGSIRTSWTSDLLKAATRKIPSALYYWPTAADILRDNSTSDLATAYDTWRSDPAGEASALRDSNGAVLAADNRPIAIPSTAGTPPQWHAAMCSNAPDWQQLLTHNLLATLESAATQHGGDAVYLDVIGAGTPTVCHATNHDHAPGDPAAHSAGHHATLTQLRAKARTINPRLGLYTEGFAEPLIDQLDGMLVENQPWWERTVPITTAVYHDYTQSIGHALWGPTHTLDIMTAWQTDVLVRGGLPGFGSVINSSSAKDRAIRAHLMQLAQRRRQWADALLYGTMLAPPELRDAGSATAGATLTIAPLATLPTTPIDTRKIALYESTVACTAEIACLVPLPTVDASAWRQPDGTIALVLGSLELASSGPPRNVALSTDTLRALAPNARSVTLSNGATLALDNVAAIAITLPRQSVVMVVLE